MPRLSQGGRHRKAQALPLSRMARSQTGDSRCFQKVGGKSEHLDIFSQEEDSESCGNSWGDLWDESCGLSDCGSVTLSGVPVVTDVPVSPSSAVAVMSETLLSDSGWEIVEPQSFSFSRKRSVVCV